MKASLVPTPPQPKAFEPVSITITFETKEELDKFGGLCNAGFTSKVFILPRYSFMEDIGADVHTFAGKYIDQKMVEYIKASARLLEAVNS